MNRDLIYFRYPGAGGGGGGGGVASFYLKMLKSFGKKKARNSIKARTRSKLGDLLAKPYTPGWRSAVIFYDSVAIRKEPSKGPGLEESQV